MTGLSDSLVLSVEGVRVTLLGGGWVETLEGLGGTDGPVEPVGGDSGRGDVLSSLAEPLVLDENCFCGGGGFCGRLVPCTVDLAGKGGPESSHVVLKPSEDADLSDGSGGSGGSASASLNFGDLDN